MMKLFLLFFFLLSTITFDNLDNIFISKDVVSTTVLRSVLYGRSPDEGVFHLIGEGAMDSGAKVADGGVALEDDGGGVIGDLALGLGVDADHVEVLPDFLEEDVEVPLLVGGDGDVVRELVEDLELLHGD